MSTSVELSCNGCLNTREYWTIPDSGSMCLDFLRRGTEGLEGLPLAGFGVCLVLTIERTVQNILTTPFEFYNRPIMTTCETCAAPFDSARSHKRHLEESPRSCIDHFHRSPIKVLIESHRHRSENHNSTALHGRPIIRSWRPCGRGNHTFK